MEPKPVEGRHLLVIGGGREIPQLALDAVAETRLSVLCRAEVLPRVRTVSTSRRTVVLSDDSSVEEWVAAAEWIHRIDPIGFVATYSEKDQDKAAAIGAALGVRAPSPETIRLVHDKAAMRRRLVASGVDSTRAVEATDEAAAVAAGAELGYPVIVKPVRGVGSLGVSSAANSDELVAAWRRCRSASEGLDEQRVLVESFIEGPEFSVEAFSDAGEHWIVCIVQKFKDPTSFIELGHVLPADLSGAAREGIARTVRAVLDAVGIEDGVTHTEVIVSDTTGEAHVIELHLRPAGDEIPYMVKDAVGVDLISLLARQSVGVPVREEIESALESRGEDAHGYEAIAFALVPTSGTLVGVEGLEQALAVDGVRDVEILAKVGEAVTQTRDSHSRLALARASAWTSDSALDLAREALSHLRFTFVTSPRWPSP